MNQITSGESNNPVTFISEKSHTLKVSVKNASKMIKKTVLNGLIDRLHKLKRHKIQNKTVYFIFVIIKMIYIGII